VTEDQLISLPGQLDELAGFESWYLREHSRLVTVLCAMLDGDRATAAELADETCARALERWDRVGRMASPGGWAYRVACNLARRRFWHGRRAADVSRLVATPHEASTPDWSLEVRDAVESLPPRERAAVMLRYVADLSQDEIAHALHVTPGTVAASLHAGREKLARLLADADGTLGPREVSHG
jgi:RNA polymerase sigma-70 factor (ECF subfamily)